MRWETEENEFSFIVNHTGVEVAAALRADASIDEVVRVFRGFLIAAGFSAENVDLYLTPE